MEYMSQEKHLEKINRLSRKAVTNYREMHKYLAINGTANPN